MRAFALVVIPHPLGSPDRNCGGKLSFSGQWPLTARAFALVVIPHPLGSPDRNCGGKLSFSLLMSSRTSPQAGVAIPQGFRNIEGIATPLRPQARAERNRREAAALSAELWRTGSQ